MALMTRLGLRPEAPNKCDNKDVIEQKLEQVRQSA